MKRMLIVLILAAMVLTACSSDPVIHVPETPEPDPSAALSDPLPSTDSGAVPDEESPEVPSLQPGFFDQNGATYYRNEDGSLQTGWLELDGARYYLDAQGILQTGWLELEGKRYYFQPDGCMSRGEIIINGRSHFFTATGEEIIIANPWNAIRDDYVPDLVEAENGYRVDRNCVDSLLQMLRDCRTAGYDAQITSAYRDHETQVYLYERKVNYYLGLGYAEADARREAGTVVAVPGTSEHELGLAVDLVDSSYWVLDEAQEHTPAQQWLMAHAWEYGFTLRYPSDKSSYTGIIYEPWHYRYVGTDLARILHESGLCLEEYLNTLS